MQHNGEDIFCPQKKTEKRVRALKCRTLLPRCLWVRLWFRTSLIVKALHAKSHWNSSTPWTPKPQPVQTMPRWPAQPPLFRSPAPPWHARTVPWRSHQLEAIRQNTPTDPLKENILSGGVKVDRINLFTCQGAVFNTPDFVEALGTCHQVRHKQTWIKFKILLHSSAVVLHTVGSHGQARPNLKPLQWKIHGSTNCWLVTSDMSCCVIPLAWTPQKGFHASRFTRMIKR